MIKNFKDVLNFTASLLTGLTPYALHNNYIYTAQRSLLKTTLGEVMCFFCELCNIYVLRCNLNSSQFVGYEIIYHKMQDFYKFFVKVWRLGLVVHNSRTTITFELLKLF